MKTAIRTFWKSLLVVFLGTLLVGQARGQIYVSSRVNTVGKYDANTGAAINPGLITMGLNVPIGLAIFGNTLYVTSEFAGTIGTYDASTGAALNANFITGLINPDGVT